MTHLLEQTQEIEVFSKQEILDAEYFLARGITAEIAQVSQTVACILQDSLGNFYHILKNCTNNEKYEKRFENIISYVDLLETDKQKILELEKSIDQYLGNNILENGTMKNMAFLQYKAKKHLSK